MPPKLRRRRPGTLLRISEPPRGLLGRGVPHVLYANVKFGAPDSQKEIDRLLSWLYPFPSGWNEKRVLRYLEAHQAEFRRCLEWLANGSNVRLAEPLGDEAERDEFWEVTLSEQWQQEPEVKFLQQHGLDHGGVTFSPYSQSGSRFNGLELGQKEPRDPVDPICWAMISMLMWDGSVNVCKCNYPKCQKFIYRPTSRREFCDNNCRAKNAADKKTPEEKNRYMKDYRSRSQAKRRRKTKS
jgi:hypothetical protein